MPGKRESDRLDAGPPPDPGNSRFRPVVGGYLVYAEGGPEEYFVPEEALDGVKNFIDGFDAVLGVVPIVGNAKDVIECITGRRLLDGQELSATERTLALVGALAVVGNIVNGVRLLSGGAKAVAAYEEAATDALKAIDEARKASDGAALHEATLRFFDATDELADAKVIRAEYNRLNESPTGQFLANKAGPIDKIADWSNLVAFIAVAQFGIRPDAELVTQDQPETESPSTFNMEADARSRTYDAEADANAGTFDMRQDIRDEESGPGFDADGEVEDVDGDGEPDRSLEPASALNAADQSEWGEGSGDDSDALPDAAISCNAPDEGAVALPDEDLSSEDSGDDSDALPDAAISCDAPDEGAVALPDEDLSSEDSGDDSDALPDAAISCDAPDEGAVALPDEDLSSEDSGDDSDALPDAAISCDAPDEGAVALPDEDLSSEDSGDDSDALPDAAISCDAPDEGADALPDEALSSDNSGDDSDALPDAALSCDAPDEGADALPDEALSSDNSGDDSDALPDAALSCDAPDEGADALPDPAISGDNSGDDSDALPDAALSCEAPDGGSDMLPDAGVQQAGPTAEELAAALAEETQREDVDVPQEIREVSG